MTEDKWTPVAPLPAPEQVVGVRVAAAGQMIRQQVKSAGGMWDAQRGVWQLRYDRVVALGLGNRIVAASPF